MKRKTIFIVGSKPDAVFPDVEPDVVYAANGAIARVQEYINKCKVVGVVSGYVFDSDTLSCTNTRQVITNKKVDKLITFYNSTNRLKYDPRFFLIFNDHRHFRRVQLLWRIIMQHKLNQLTPRLKILIQTKGVMRFLIDFAIKNKIQSLKISTGFICLLLSLSEHGDLCDYYLIGIGFDSNTAHFYALDKMYPSSHIDNDINFLKTLYENKQDARFILTDPSANLIFNHGHRGPLKW